MARMLSYAVTYSFQTSSSYDCVGVARTRCHHAQLRSSSDSLRVPAQLAQEKTPPEPAITERAASTESAVPVHLAAHSLPEDSHRLDAHRHATNAVAVVSAEDQPTEQSEPSSRSAAAMIRASEVSFFDKVQDPADSSSFGYTLEQLIATALGASPAIRQAESAVAKAAGYRYQVSLRPNPWVGYNGTQLADRATDQHTVVVQQSVITAQKLQRNTAVLNYEVENLKWQAEQQRRAVTNDVKQSFYEVLGAQQKLVLSKQFVQMAEKAVEVVQQRKKAGEGTEVDVLQSEVQLQQVIIANRQAIAVLAGARSRLAATINQPNTVDLIVNGELPGEPKPYQWDEEYKRICSESPELMAAQTRVARARANLNRQRVQAHPNIDWMLGAGYDNGTDSQMINTQVGIPLPVNNQNEGNQSAAHAEYCRAMHEVERIQLSLKARLAIASQAYESASASVTTYKSAVIPKAEKMLELAEITFKAGEIDFLQVLTIRRTYFDSMFEYLSSRTQLAQAGANIDELLLSGSLDNSVDSSLDDGLRDQSFTGQ